MLADSGPTAVPPYDLREAHGRGLLVLGRASWEELAESLEVAAVPLRDAVDRTTPTPVPAPAPCSVATDWATTLRAFAGCRHRVERPPATTAVLATYCGLRIPPETQALDVFGEPVVGLRAAGEITGGFHAART